MEINPAAAQAVAAELGAVAVQGDVSERTGVQAMVDSAIQHYGGLEALLMPVDSGRCN